MENTLIAPFIFWAIYLSSNLAALLLLWLSVKQPRAGRAGFSLLFAAACWFNLSLAMEMSWLYSRNAEIITMPYHFLLGKTLGNITKPILWLAAICQGLAAVALTLRGNLFVLGCWCAMILCIALIPLGIRAAFPAPIVAVLALYYLQKAPQHTYLWSK